MHGLDAWRLIEEFLNYFLIIQSKMRIVIKPIMAPTHHVQPNKIFEKKQITLMTLSIHCNLQPKFDKGVICSKFQK